MRLVLAAAVAVAAVSAATAQVRPPDRGAGAAVSIADPRVPPGGQISFTGTGFTRDDGKGGQAVVVKLDDQAVLGEFRAAADGSVSGAVPAPRAEGAHWLRFLAGSGGLSGQGGTGEPPARTLTADFTVAAAPAPTATASPGPTATATATPYALPVLRVVRGPLRAGRRAVTVPVYGSGLGAASVRVAIRARGRVLARGSRRPADGGTTFVRARLTRAGRRVKRRSLRVRVTATVAGRTARRTLTYRR